MKCNHFTIPAMTNCDIVGDWRIRINGMEHGALTFRSFFAMEAVCRLRSRRAKYGRAGRDH